MAAELHNPFGDILKVPELKRRILFSLAIIAAILVVALLVSWFAPKENLT